MTPNIEFRNTTRIVLAENLRRLRKERNWSQAELAVKAELHPSEISRLEHGAREPRLVTVLAVAKALGVPLKELLEPKVAAEDEPVA